jgi:hypothetical protein
MPTGWKESREVKTCCIAKEKADHHQLTRIIMRGAIPPLFHGSSWRGA